MKTQLQISFINSNQQGFSAKELLGVLAVVGLIIIAACFGGYYASQYFLANPQPKVETSFSPPAVTATDTQTQPQSTIVIKGLYIGMDFNVLPDAISQKFGSGQWQIEKDNYPYCYVKNLDLEKMRNSYQPTGYMPDDLKTPASIKVSLTFDAAGKLQYVEIPHRVADWLFGGSSMTAKEFGQNFANSYQIPTLNRDVGTDGTGFWKYTSPDNVMVKITDDKDVYIERAASQSQVQSKFN